MQEAAQRTGLSLGEETITETLLLWLALNYPGHLTIVPFTKLQESANGADWVWAFESSDRRYVLPLIIQAKRLYQKHMQYEQLPHVIGRKVGGERQIDRLIRVAPSLGCFPIYAFYQAVSEAELPRRLCQSIGGRRQPPLWGVSVADAYVVRRTLDNPASRDDCQFSSHSRNSLPLHCLLCSVGTGIRDPKGSPGQAAQALRHLRGLVTSGAFDADDYPRRPPEPTMDVPPVIGMARRLAETPPEEIDPFDDERLREKFPNVAGVVFLRDAEDGDE